MLFNQIEDDWKTITKNDEVKVLKKYSEQGRFFTLNYLRKKNFIF